MQIHLITGSNRGIGLELAKRYLDHGDIVYACCRSPKTAQALLELKEAFPDRVNIAKLDASGISEIESLADALRDQSVKLDTLIANAGVLHPEAFGDWSEEAFLSTWRVNLAAPAFLAQACLPLLKPGSKIIALSSRIGSFDCRISLQGDADAYALSKAALNMLVMRLAAKPDMQDKIVAAISPGWVRTDMGGPKAELSVEESAKGIVEVIESLSSSQSGSFLSIEGDSIPW